MTRREKLQVVLDKIGTHTFRDSDAIDAIEKIFAEEMPTDAEIEEDAMKQMQKFHQDGYSGIKSLKIAYYRGINFIQNHKRK